MFILGFFFIVVVVFFVVVVLRFIPCQMTLSEFSTRAERLLYDERILLHRHRN